MYKFNISVIIPIYGVEQHIERCARSLFEQSLNKGVEYIFINDATKDKSIDLLTLVIKDYPELSQNTKIIHHSENKGLPAARNTGLKYAEGEYVMHVDGDDYLEKTALEELYHAAKAKDADAVWCNYYISFTKNKKIIRQPVFREPKDAVIGMLRGAMKYNVWNKLCRKSIYDNNDIKFPEGYSMGEDLTMIMVFLNAKSCAFVDKALYNYVQSPYQMTANYSEDKLLSLQYNCNRLAQYIDQNFNEQGYRNEYSALKQLMKWPFLLDGKHSSYKRWIKWFPESNKYIWQTKGVNTRIKFIEWCASKHLYPIIRLHYLIVIKFYYGIVYR